MAQVDKPRAFWTAEEISVWLNRGLARRNQPRHSADKETALWPLVLASYDDVALKIINYLGVSQAPSLKWAVRSALTSWAKSDDLGVLSDLLLLARYIRPPEIASVARFLLGELNPAPPAQRSDESEQALLDLVLLICACVAQPGVPDLLADLRTGPWWRPRFAANWLRCQVRTGHIGPFSGLLLLESDMNMMIEDGLDLGWFFGRMLNDVAGLRTVALDLEAVQPQLNDHRRFRTMLRALFMDQAGMGGPLEMVLVEDDRWVLRRYRGKQPAEHLLINDLLDESGDDDIDFTRRVVAWSFLYGEFGYQRADKPSADVTEELSANVTVLAVWKANLASPEPGRVPRAAGS